MRNYFLVAEFVCLFFCMPLVISFMFAEDRSIFLIFLGAFIAVWLLWSGFNPKGFFSAEGLLRNLGVIIPRFLLLSIPILILCYSLNRSILDIPSEPLAFIGLYAIFSVYPQNIIYRGFLLHRYRPLFKSKVAMILASSAAFAFMHIIFFNWVAIILTLFGGIIFARTYLATNSILIASIEHALYGSLVFLTGLGYFLS